MSPAAHASVDEPVREVVRDLRTPVLVLSDTALELGMDDVRVRPVGTARPDPAPRSVVLVVEDVAELRRAASDVTGVGRVRHVVCVVRRSPAALTLRADPAWPAVRSLEATLDGAGAVTRVELDEPMPAELVLLALARGAAPPVPSGGQGLRPVVLDGRTLPPVDPRLMRAYDPAARHPADVVLGSAGTGTVSDPLEESPVIGRAPVRVADAAEPDDLMVGPIDEAIFSPRGFPRAWETPPADLDPAARLTPALVEELRAAQGVRVRWPADARTVAGLAMCGVPLVCDPVPADVRGRLGDRLADLLPEPADLDNPLRREERSVRLRRAALAEHGTMGWRLRLAAYAGVRPPACPSVSLLLPTRRPEQLAWVLAQAARQRPSLPGVELEVVLATHGFDPDRGQVAELLGGRAHVVVPVAPAAVLGEVLRAATDAASGDLVMKLDDDDWYGPDVVTDLLLARRYSGADLVGMPAEFVYLEADDLTIRRRGPSENFGAFVSGGTLMIERSTLRGLGGFAAMRVQEDARLLDALIRAGGTVYRTHGLGYVLRRRASGHTWDPGADYFLRPETIAERWPGFHPSRLVEAEPVDQ